MRNRPPSLDGSFFIPFFYIWDNPDIKDSSFFILVFFIFIMELKRVVVTGLGAVTPVGNNPQDMWKNLLAGVSGAAPITSFDTTNFKTKFACEVKDLKVEDYLDRKEARKMDRYTQLALISAKQAVEDCGWDLEK